MGIRMTYPHPSLGLFDHKEVLLNLDAVGPCAPDLSYVRYAWRVPVTHSAICRFATTPWAATNAPMVFDFTPEESAHITLQWRVQDDCVVGRYSSSRTVRVGLIVNGCFAAAKVMKATKTRCSMEQGRSRLVVRLKGDVAKPHIIDTRMQAEQAWQGTETPTGKYLAHYPVTLKPGSPLYFTMTAGAKAEDPQRSCPLPDADKIDQSLRRAKKKYERSRMLAEGGFAGAAQAVTDLSGYSRMYDPDLKRIQQSNLRSWIGPNRPGMLAGWDNLFISYIAAWENPQLAAASLEHIISMFRIHGISRPPTQRVLIIPVLYCRTLDVIGDKDLAGRTWDTMMRFMAFFFSDRGNGILERDGNGDGLIEAGTSSDPGGLSPGLLIQQAMDETGYDDLPVYSGGSTSNRLGLLAEGVEFDWASQCLTVNLIGQNSLYCASCNAMLVWAKRLGKDDDAKWLRAEAKRISDRIKEQLYCGEDGFFRDRYWNGKFSPVKAMTIFYPLLAGIADDSTKARLKEVLLDPQQFWGENLIPTVSRDDPAYCDHLDKRGNYWRGNCWPPSTYIVYLGIKQAGWDEIAAQYAQRTYAQFMEYWEPYRHAYENYPPEGKVDHDFLYIGNWGGRDMRFVWASMLLFCGLEEIFGLELEAGLRFGNPHLPEESSWKRFYLAGDRIEATAGPQRTHVKYGQEWEFSAKPGVCVRRFHTCKNEIRFTVNAAKSAQIELSARRFNATSTLLINAKPVSARYEKQTLTFEVPPGENSVVIGHTH